MFLYKLPFKCILVADMSLIISSNRDFEDQKVLKNNTKNE